MDPEQPKPADKPPGLFTGKLSGWQILVAVAVVGYLLYGKWSELNQPPAPAPASAAAPHLCDSYRQTLRELTQGTSRMEVKNHGGPDAPLFVCTAEDMESGRSAALGARRDGDPAQRVVAQRKLFETDRYQVSAEPALGAEGFGAFESRPAESPHTVVVYLGHSRTHAVEVRLSRLKASVPDLSEDEKRQVREVAVRLVRELD
jgi:hypothetical protein